MPHLDITPDVLRAHIEYSAWASAKLVAAAAELSAEELTRDFQTADHSVLGTLVHVFGADRVWFARVQGRQSGPFLDPERDMHLSVLQTDWPAIYDQWKNWAAGLTGESILSELIYQDLKGNPHRTPIWQVVLHVVNHATHHRGQAAGFMRSMEHKPPVIDLIAYYRELAAAAAGR